MSEAIVNKYVATSDKLGDLRAIPVGKWDKQFKNQCLRNRDQLLYVDLCQAMNAGDICQVEACFLLWIYIFYATGKHKYAAQINKFSINLQYVYPKDLCHIISVDWLVEQNNLYTKVFHNCHIIVENTFYLKNRTIQHTHPDMTATIEKLRSYIQSTLSYISQSRSTKQVIEDQIAVEMKLIQQKKVSQTMSGEEHYEAEPQDFINN
ncbi:uncharacterized protein EDB91DRAFT_1235536 [Suillus paluster]|uniref:uncharacterized protein n=1 Tax=Suillus paluster TaxID=48578 RepID=UPI001B87E7F2|nr:uncharacterized protein EDB91DRAFT_1235536 [Suillus paluster]KAG1748997.1 hypothetical protein EDB91DRAFT_1235536 [Suillus paluster]